MPLESSRDEMHAQKAIIRLRLRRWEKCAPSPATHHPPSMMVSPRHTASPHTTASPGSLRRTTAVRRIMRTRRMRRTFRSYAHGCARSRWTRSAPTTTKHTCCTTTADAPPMQRSTATASAPILASSTALTRSLQALERDKLPIFSSRTCRSCASVSTVGACAASVYAQSGYAATTHRTAHSNTTFRPEGALTGRARTQPTTIVLLATASPKCSPQPQHVAMRCLPSNGRGRALGALNHSGSVPHRRGKRRGA